MTTPRTPQAGGSRPPFRRGGRRRRQCFCKESTVDYKDVSSIRRFITDRGRIEAGKKSGNCAKCQRNLTTAIKRARHLALLPYAPEHLRVTGAVSTSKISDDDKDTKDDEATDSTEVAEVTEETPATEADSSEEAVEESDSEETEAAAEDVSTAEASEATEENGGEEAEAESSDEEDK